MSKGIVTFHASNGWVLAERAYGGSNKFRFIVWSRLNHLEKKGKKVAWYHVCPETDDEMVDEHGVNTSARKRYERVTNLSL